MSTSETFEREFRTWLESEAGGEIPTRLRDRALSAAVGRRPRVAPVAGIAGHWIADAPRIPNVGLRPLLVVVAVLVALVLLGTALLVAAPQPPPLPAGGRQLLYARDGDIVLANLDGSGATVVADGDPGPDSENLFGLEPEVWAPDGRHFVYPEYRPTDVASHIADPTGRMVATFVMPTDAPVRFWGRPTGTLDATNFTTRWSPDSTMLTSFPDAATEVAVFGLDGNVVTTVRLPAGYARYRPFGLSGWTPDGRSVLAAITSPAVNLQPEVWELPLDGSAPRQVPDGDPFVNPGWSLSPDGRHVAFSGHVALDGSARYGALPAEGADTIYVADADGHNQRPVSGTTRFSGVGGPQWSPDGTRILYTTAGSRSRYELHVADLVTGNDYLVAKVSSNDWAGHAWSPHGDAILIAASAVEPGIGRPQPPQQGAGSTPEDSDALVSLWRVSSDGTTVELLVEGANHFAVTR